MPAFDLTRHYRTHPYVLLFDGLPEAAFREAIGLDAKEKEHGGKLILTDGLTDADSLWRWCKRCLEHPDLAAVRRNGELAVVERDGRQSRRWRFRVARCIGFLGPQVDPEGETVAVHGLALEHEGLAEAR